MSTKKSKEDMKRPELFNIVVSFFIKKYPEYGPNPKMTKIAKELGVPWHRVRDWANGSQPGADDVLRLADNLGLSLRWLLGGGGAPLEVDSEKVILLPGTAIGADTALALPEGPTDSEAVPAQPEVTARCTRLEEDLRLEREEMRRKDAELRELHREHQRVLRENADLRERVARLEAQSLKPELTGLSATADKTA